MGTDDNQLSRISPSDLTPTLQPKKPQFAAVGLSSTDGLTRKKVASAIGHMLTALRTRPDTPPAAVREYLDAVKYVEPSVIYEAVERFKTGRVREQNKAFPPTAAEFSAECRNLENKPSDLARQRINDTMNAIRAPLPPPRSEAESRRTDKMLERLKAGLTPKPKAKTVDPVDFEKRLAELAEANDGDVASPALKEILDLEKGRP